MALIASITTSSLTANNFYLEPLQSGCSSHSVNTGVTPPQHKFRVLNCGERAEATYSSSRGFQVGKTYAIGMRYHITSDFRQNVFQLSHYFSGIPNSFFHPSNGGNYRVGSYIFGASSGNVEFGLQIPDPAAPTSRVQYTSYSLGSKSALVGKTLDIVMHFKAATDTSGFFKVYTSINGAAYQLKVDRNNIRTAWSSMDGVTVPSGWAGKAKVGCYTGDPGNGIAEAVISNVRVTEGANAVVEATPGSTPVNGSAPEPEPTPTAVRINCGGAAVGDFSAEQYGTGGETHNYGDIAIANTTMPELYRTARNAPEYSEYVIPASATSNVSLHFSENSQTAANRRLMNISINGTVVEFNLDIYAEAGGAKTALIKQYSNISPVGGAITIRIARASLTPWATINAIRVTPV